MEGRGGEGKGREGKGRGRGREGDGIQQTKREIKPWEGGERLIAKAR